MTEAVQEQIPGMEELLEEAAEAPYHTVLEIWTKVLEPAAADMRITPQWSNRIVSAYNDVRFIDMGEYRDRFAAKVLELADILRAVLEEDDEAVQRTSAEEDATLNHHHYMTVLFAWQQRILMWELEWEWDDPCAGVEMAAISEVHKMFFAQEGLTSLLDQIGFQFDDSDRQALAEMLEETRAGAE